MSYDIKKIILRLEEEMYILTERDQEWTRAYTVLARKARVMRRVYKLFLKMEQSIGACRRYGG